MAPWVRYASIIYHYCLDDGLPSRSFFETLKWGSARKNLAELVEFAFNYIAEGEKSIPRISEKEAENYWKHHAGMHPPRAICRCPGYPRPYSEKDTMSQADIDTCLQLIINSTLENAKRSQRELEKAVMKRLEVFWKSKCFLKCVQGMEKFRRFQGEDLLFRGTEQGCWGEGVLAPSLLAALDAGTEDAIRGASGLL